MSSRCWPPRRLRSSLVLTFSIGCCASRRRNHWPHRSSRPPRGDPGQRGSRPRRYCTGTVCAQPRRPASRRPSWWGLALRLRVVELRLLARRSINRPRRRRSRPTSRVHVRRPGSRSSCGTPRRELRCRRSIAARRSRPTSGGLQAERSADEAAFANRECVGDAGQFDRRWRTRIAYDVRGSGITRSDQTGIERNLTE